MERNAWEIFNNDMFSVIMGVALCAPSGDQFVTEVHAVASIEGFTPSIEAAYGAQAVQMELAMAGALPSEY